jgi:hypothetical protein
MPIIFGCLAFMALFILTRQLQPHGILFYQGLACAALSAAVQGLVALHRTTGQRLAIAKDALLTLLLAYAFMFTVPTTVDRAYSVRLIQQLSKHPDGMTRAEMEDWFAQRFIRQGGVERRIHEQLATGSLREHEGRFKLTERGQWLANSFAAFQTVFRCDTPR